MVQGESTVVDREEQAGRLAITPGGTWPWDGTQDATRVLQELRISRLKDKSTSRNPGLSSSASLQRNICVCSHTPF